MIGTVVHEIDGTCYYVTSLNNQTVLKFEEGEKRDKVIKKLAYQSGPRGGEVTSPEGTGKTAVLTEAVEEPAVEELAEEIDAELDSRTVINVVTEDDPV